jgi:hypothetical protein
MDASRLSEVSGQHATLGHPQAEPVIGSPCYNNTDADQHAGAADVVDLEMRYFRRARARAIGKPERRPVLDTRCRPQQAATSPTLRTSGDLRLTAQDQVAKQVGAI